MGNALIKNKCEIESCDISDPDLLELHHIIERAEKNTSHNKFNLAILCCTHHKMVDGGRLKIIGVFPSTKFPNNRTLVYQLDGIQNVEGIESSYCEIKNKAFKI